ncbi:MAG: 3-hydroxyacyl-CoA dehydrogenase [Candidatus Nitrosocosmicus sp.]
MSSQNTTTSDNKSVVSRLFVLDLSGGRIFSINTYGTDLKTLVTDCRHPDGIAVDVESRHIYWSNMGIPDKNDGSIERVDLDGKNRQIIIPKGGTFTPKQICLDKKNGKLYWSDREGLRVMRSNVDGSNIEILIENGNLDSDRLDATKWCVGIAVDVENKKLYWTQKGPDNAGKGRIFFANTEIPNGQNATNRNDIEVLFEGLPEPIDLDLDLDRRFIYWTDRGDPPSGNTVNRAPMDQALIEERQAPEILLNHLMEGIGIALDIKGERMYLTDLGGSVYSANLDGSNKNTLLSMQGNLTGISYVEMPLDIAN